MQSPHRRVLAPLDANTMASTAAASLKISATAMSTSTSMSTSTALPLSPPATIEPKKRALDAGRGVASDETPSKRMCLPATPAVEPRRAREEARKRADILKLRLGLARYKVRTGQVDVPLERLRVVPAATQRYVLQGLQGRQQSTRLLLPPVTPQRKWPLPHQTEDDDDRSSDDDEDLPQQPRRPMVRAYSASSAVVDSKASPMVGHEQKDNEEEKNRPPAPVQSGPPAPRPMPCLTTPRGNRQLIEPTNVSSSGMRGSATAVSGLLSLARS